MIGRLCARFELRAGRTEVTHLACQPPLQALRALRPDGADGPAEVRIATLGPGLMGDDVHEIRVEAAANSRVRLTTSAATRVLPMREGRPSEVDVSLVVAPGAALSWRPLPTILEAGAAYRQTIDLALADGAIAVVSDVLVPGRLARGERFAFAELDTTLRVRTPDGCLLTAERLRVCPADGGIDGLAALPGPDVVVGSLWILARGRPFPIPAAADHVGIAELPNQAGLLVRTLAPTAQVAACRLDLALALINPQGETL